ncbi:N-acetyltransferase [Vibrio vulnificus]|nr:N-acetyltransferase [Vibrio vulnificus]
MNLVTRDVESDLYRVHLHGEHYATVRYRLEENTMAITSTHIPEQLRGAGYGKVMMEALLAEIEARGYKVIPVCSYVKHYLDRHPQWQHLL